MKHSTLIRLELPANAGRSGPDAEERVVSVVVEGVLSHRLSAGDRVTERELCEASGAARTAVRSALGRLANAGLVELVRNRGALIIQPSREEIREIFEARIVVEEAALRSLALTIDADGLEELRSIVNEETTALADEDIDEARRLARHFHVKVSKLAGNRRLTQFLEDLINCQPLLSAKRYGQPSQFFGAPTHLATIEALANRDGDKAAWLNTNLLRELESEMEFDRAQPETEGAGEINNDQRRTGSRADMARRGADKPT